MKCQTRSGHYQCCHDLKPDGSPHAGNCEADEIPPATLGPYTDAFRARAYLRGMLDVLSGGELATVGLRLGVTRREEEDDCTLRERVWRAKR